MAIKCHKPEAIATKQRQVEVLVGPGMARIDAIRKISITEQTFYPCRPTGWTNEHCHRLPSHRAQ